MGAAKLKPIHEVRKRNLNKVIEAKFGGNASEAARAIERSHTFMWQLVGGYRGVGERIARHIEQKLELGANALDAIKAERTKRLIATDGEGGTKSFPVWPELRLDALNAKPVDFIVMPLEYDVEARGFSAVIDHEDVVELQQGDRIFVDRGMVKPVARALFVCQVRGGAKVGVVLMSRKAGVFSGTGDGARIMYPASKVEVIGRVILIVRQLTR